MHFFIEIIEHILYLHIPYHRNMKTLLSWIANTNDFEAGKVLETGPTANYHKYFFKFPNKLSVKAQRILDIIAVRFIWIKNISPAQVNS